MIFGNGLDKPLISIRGIIIDAILEGSDCAQTVWHASNGSSWSLLGLYCKMGALKRL
jgi:hypothetical protein